VIAVVADVHMACHRVLGGPVVAGLNQRAREIADTLGRARQLAQASGARELVIAGDLFDTPHPSPQLVAAALDAIQPHSWARVTALVGNHDQVTSEPGDHALGPLRHAGVLVADTPQLVGSVLCLPFERATKRPVLDRLAELLVSTPIPEGCLLAIHAGIDDGSAPSWLRGSLGSVELEPLARLYADHGVRAVVAGDWHAQASWTRHGVQVSQVGALVPTGWDNPGLAGYGGLVTWDGRDLRTYQIPGPRFLSATSVDDAAVQLASQQSRAHTCRVTVTVPLDQLETATAGMQALANSGFPHLAGWQVRPDGRMLAQDTMRALETTQDPAHQADRLASYVAGCPLPEGVDRDRVLGLCRDALVGGQP
jgi:hypothetical protein